MLDKNNKCKVYDNRPFLCNITACSQIEGIDKEDFYSKNIEACNSMMDMDGVDLELRIKKI